MIMRSWILLLCVSVWGLECPPQPADACAPRQDEPTEIDFKLMADLRVRVVRDDGEPIAGAQVTPYAMRAKENANGHGYWNDDLIGPPKAVATGEDGYATVRYPVNIGQPSNPRTTGLVSLQVHHPDYVSMTVHFTLGPDAAVVTLKVGCEVALTAVDARGQKIEDFAVLMAGPQAPELWAKTDDGGRRTRAATDGSWQTMLVKTQADGPTLFSGLMPLRVRPKQAVQIREVRLTPGAVLTGMLSNNVPRPIANGHVLLGSAPKPANDSWNEEEPSLVWYDWTPIQPDGGFRFGSIPRGGIVQLLAVCDGWVATTDFEEAGQHFVMGQSFEVNDDSNEVLVQMEPTGVLDVTVVDEQGQPVTEGSLSSWPNQKLLLGGSTLLGERFRTADFVERQLHPAKESPNRPSWKRGFPFQAKLDSEGKVRLTGIPLKRSYSLGLSHPTLVLAPAGERFLLETPTPKSIQIEATSGSNR